MVEQMLAEFDRYVTYENTRIEVDAEERVYRRDGRHWRMIWRRTATAFPSLSRGDTLLTEVALSAAEQADFLRRGVHWLDLQGRTRSEDGCELTEELAAFLGRYGIRLPRIR
jgi:hypothetical protein